MGIPTIVIALVAAVIAWKVLTGLIKFAVIGLVVLAAIYILSQGGLV